MIRGPPALRPEADSIKVLTELAVGGYPPALALVKVGWSHLFLWRRPEAGGAQGPSMEQRSIATTEGELQRLAERVAHETGVELVEVSLRGAGSARVLRVDIDRAGPRGVDLDDCQRFSRSLGTALDESELIASTYHLEVSSPGIDRPIRSDDDIRRNTGRPVRVLTDDPGQGRRCHRGRLLGAHDGFLLLEVEGAEPLRVARERVVKAQQDPALGRARSDGQ